MDLRRGGSPVLPAVVTPAWITATQWTSSACVMESTVPGLPLTRVKTLRRMPQRSNVLCACVAMGPPRRDVRNVRGPRTGASCPESVEPVADIACLVRSFAAPSLVSSDTTWLHGTHRRRSTGVGGLVLEFVSSHSCRQDRQGRRENLGSGSGCLRVQEGHPRLQV